MNDTNYQFMPAFGPEADINVKEATAAKKYRLGQKYEDSFGRTFRYTKNGGTALVQALMTQCGITATSQFTAVVQTGYARKAGDRKRITCLVVTDASAVVGGAEDAFESGFLVCNKVSPAVVGDIYPILSSKVLDATHIQLDLATPWVNDMLATGEITLTVSRWYGSTVVPNATATQAVNGVPLCAVAANYYYWSQTKGPAPIVVDTGETLVIGQAVGNPETLAVPGACGPVVSTDAAQVRDVWGTALSIAVAGEPALVDLCVE